MEDTHSPPRGGERNCLSGSKRFAPERHHRSREATLLLNHTSTSPEPDMPGSLPLATMSKVSREQTDSPSAEGYQSDDSSCTLRNETPEAEKEAQVLKRPVESVEWVPSQKYMETLAICDTRSDIETSSGNKEGKARGRPVDNLEMSTQHQPIWGGLVETFSKKRKHNTVEQGTEESEEIAETSDPKRKRLPHLSPQLESIPQTPTTSHTMTSRSTLTEVPSSDIDDMSSISSIEETPVKPKRGGTQKGAPTRKVSLNQFRELPQLPERNLTAILRARYSSSTTPTRNIQADLRNSTSNTLGTSTPSTLRRSTASISTLTPRSFSDDDRFEASFRSAFDEWMDKHGKGIVEAVVKEAVEKEIIEVKKAARRAVENASVKDRSMRSREREWSTEVAVDAEKEKIVVEDSQGYIDNDEC